MPSVVSGCRGRRTGRIVRRSSWNRITISIPDRNQERRHPMRVEDLGVFTVLAETQSLRRAADKVGLTQSAITKILHRLETEFELPLVERHTRGVALTPAGRILLERASALKNAVGDLKTEMLALKSAKLGTIRVGTIPALLETTFLPLLPRLLAR